MHVHRTKDWRYITVSSVSKTCTEVYTLDAMRPDGGVELVKDREAGAYSPCGCGAADEPRSPDRSSTEGAGDVSTDDLSLGILPARLGPCDTTGLATRTCGGTLMHSNQADICSGTESKQAGLQGMLPTARQCPRTWRPLYGLTMHLQAPMGCTVSRA